MKVLKDLLKANEDRKIIIMPVGISGSGKTKLYIDLNKEFDIHYISFDKIRINLYRKDFPDRDKISYHDAYRYVSDKKMKILPIAKKEFINSKSKIVYIDNTNLTKKARRKFLCIADGYLRIAVYFEPNIRECIKRQFGIDRDKRVKPSVILDQFSIIERPDFSEFDIILTKKIDRNINEKGSSDNRRI